VLARSYAFIFTKHSTLYGSNIKALYFEEEKALRICKT
jgi:hypothetical protein